jgi:hypothetical protein
MSKKVIRAYGCGGCGINLVSQIASFEEAPGTASLECALIDTSRSNLQDRKAASVATYLVEGLDGSGKIRAENYHAIDKEIRQILVDIEPGDMNLIVFSASGGSGSVIGPLLIRELNERKIPNMAIVVGDDSSIIAAENTLKTLQSLEGISKNTGLPVVMYNVANGEQRAAADKAVFSVVACLAILFSGLNAELDSKDLQHWLQYTKVSGGQPQLAAMRLATTRSEYDNLRGPISVASLYSSTSQEHLRSNSDYHTVGYADLSGTNFNELHFSISIEEVAIIAKAFTGTVDKMREVKQARVTPDNILTTLKDGQATDKGLVL